MHEMKTFVDSFREYARRCREFSVTTAGVMGGGSWMHHAEKWEKDAEQIEMNIAAIVNSRNLLDLKHTALETAYMEVTTVST